MVTKINRKEDIEEFVPKLVVQQNVQDYVYIEVIVTCLFKSLMMLQEKH